MDDYSEVLSILPAKLIKLRDALNDKDIPESFKIADDIQNDCFALKLFIATWEIK